MRREALRGRGDFGHRAPRRYTDEIFRVLVMSSSGLASSTMKSALLPASIVPASAMPQELGAVARRGDDDLLGVIPASTMSAISTCGAHGRVAVGAERDPHAGRVQLRQVARLDAVEGLRRRPVVLAASSFATRRPEGPAAASSDPPSRRGPAGSA